MADFCRSLVTADATNQYMSIFCVVIISILHKQLSTHFLISTDSLQQQAFHFYTLVDTVHVSVTLYTPLLRLFFSRFHHKKFPFSAPRTKL